MKILVTGSAGFIGFHLSKRLLAEKHEVVGIDNINDYYDVNLKNARLAILEKDKNFSFVKEDIANLPAIEKLFAQHKFDAVVNLAAQAGVRYSLVNPFSYIDSNIVGFTNIIETYRKQPGNKNFVFASSSSVYGANTGYPFSEEINIDHPLSIYAATKKANELIAHSYASLYGLPCTGLRFFTAYGPWGRPDMALFMFTKSILEDKTIEVFNNGEMMRDFTYVDDIVEGIYRVTIHPAEIDPEWSAANPNPATSYAPYRIYNIGNNSPVKLMDFISAIENKLGKTAKKKYLPLQIGDIPKTYADVSRLIRDFDFQPKTTIQEGVNHFIDWYLAYFKVKH